jgi:hypothetical protein
LLIEIVLHRRCPQDITSFRLSIDPAHLKVCAEGAA